MFYDICNYQLGSKCNTISLVTVLLEKMNITPEGNKKRHKVKYVYVEF